MTGTLRQVLARAASDAITVFADAIGTWTAEQVTLAVVPQKAGGETVVDNDLWFSNSVCFIGFNIRTPGDAISLRCGQKHPHPGLIHHDPDTGLWWMPPDDGG